MAKQFTRYADLPSHLSIKSLVGDDQKGLPERIARQKIMGKQYSSSEWEKLLLADAQSVAPTEMEALFKEIGNLIFQADAAQAETAGYVLEENQQTAGEEKEKSYTEAKLSGIELRYRTLIEQIPAVVFMAFLDKAISEAYVSPYIEAALGFTQEEWLEDPVRWYYQIHPDDRTRWSHEFAQMLLTNQPLSAAYQILARDGRVVCLQCEAKLVRDNQGRPWFIHGVGFDITELKQAESSLRKARDELEIRVQERTAELAKANAELTLEITERQRIEQDRERLIAELQESLAQIKTLGGMLPVCSFCKKIRDDQGNWQQMELYLRERTEAEFSHSFCPDCAKQHYPEFY
jgi:PAS domain S-box-containing protein